MNRELFGFQDKLKSRLLGALIGMARATFENQHLVNDHTFRLVLKGLLIAGEKMDSNDETASKLIEKVEVEKRRLSPGCASCTVACGKNNNYDMNNLWKEKEDILSLKLRIFQGVFALAEASYYMEEAEYKAAGIDEFIYRALFAVGADDWEEEDLLPIETEAEELKHRYM